MEPALVMARTRAHRLIVLVIALLTACNNGPATPDNASVDSVLVSPQTGSVMVGSSLSLSAQALDAEGQAIPSASVTWSSEDATVASVSSSGLVTGVRPGTVKIAASAWGKNAVATITVNPSINVFPQVSRIVIAPSNPRITEGASLQMTASVLDAQDRVIMGLTITWSSSNTSRATVDQNGLVRGVNDGNVTISASAGGKNGSTTVRVER